MGVGLAGPGSVASPGDVSAGRRELVCAGSEPTSSCCRHPRQPCVGAGSVSATSLWATTSSCPCEACHPSTTPSSRPLPGGAAPGPSRCSGQGSYPSAPSQSSVFSVSVMSSLLSLW